MTVTPSIFTHSFGFGLICSVDIFNDIEELGVPPPTFEWFFGPNDNASLPSGVAVSTVMNNGTTYSSTLLFFLPEVSHAGMYTCRLRGNPRLEANTTITVNTVQGIASESSSPPSNFNSVIALSSAILLVVFTSTTILIALLCAILR